MKKSIAILIHVLSVLLFAAGLGALHRFSKTEAGITWIEAGSFEDSAVFSEMVSEDIAKIKHYAVLKDAFEDEGNGEVNDEKIIVSGETKNGTTYYKIQDLISQAARYGYIFDEKTHRISISEADSWENPYEVKLNYKAFDPFYFENIEPGPSQGITNIKELSIEGVRALSEYYELKSVYESEQSNFLYTINFSSANDYELSVGNTTKNPDEIIALGKYLVVTEAGSLETNISPQPENVMSEDGSLKYSDDDEDPVVIGIDTTFLFNDRYKKAADGFADNINTVRGWMLVMAVCAVSAVTSLVFAVRGFNEADRRELVMDKIPIEALIFLFACLSLILYVLFKFSINHIFEELLNYADWEFWRDMAKGIIVWFLCVIIGGSVYRRSLNGGSFKNSVTAGLFRTLSDEGGSNAAAAAFGGYAVFIAIHAVTLLFMFYCYGMQVEGPNYTIALIICLVLILAFDIFIYIRRYHGIKQRLLLSTAIKEISDGNVNCKIDESVFEGETLEAARHMNNISVGLQTAINEQVKADKLKADLITNVSHDIRTPLTSIINYVDLMKRENVSDPKLREYIEVLDKKSARLKNLTEDLLEASKASSGNIKMDMRRIDLVELAIQAGGEFEDKFAKRRLEMELTVPEHPVYVTADGRHLWRVLENLYNNAAKYALEGTRVYVDVESLGEKAKFTIKNVSADKLNISPDELTERFVRGDISRNTEGSGLGLNIATSLTRLMGGELLIEIDGDLYKAAVLLKSCEQDSNSACETDIK